MAFAKVVPEETTSRIPAESGHMWFLKDALDTEHVAFTVLELEPGERGMEHDHADQEEVYYVEVGGVDVEVGDQRVALAEGEAMRIDPAETRRILNREEFSRLILVGAPRDAE